MSDSYRRQGNLLVMATPTAPITEREALRVRGARCHRFDEFELDLTSAELLRHGVPIQVSWLSLQLLEYLLVRRERMVARDELLQAVWSDVTVTAGSVRQAIFELRKALDDCAGEPRFIRTVRGRGYQFMAAVREPAAPPEPERPAARASGSFFGRTSELARLVQALDGAAGGSGRCCVLSGAPGIGKSRLVCELLSCARSRRIGVLEGWADPEGRTPPLGPWLQMLRGHLRTLGAAQTAALHHAFPVIRRLLDDAPREASAAVEADAAKQRRTDLLRELSEAFVAIASAQPLVLLLEDAQWADEASLALLTQLATLLSQTSALLLVTHRDVPMREHRTLGRALAALQRGALNEHLKIEQLGPEELAQLLALHVADVTPQITADVSQISRGNPLFALELARLFARADGSGGVRGERPRELQAVIKSRLSFLPESAAEAARAASVLGLEFSLGELAGILGCDSAAALALVDAIIELGVVDETASPGRFRFAHPLLRDALYDALPRLVRVQLHQRAGEWLEQLGEDASDVRVAALAHHFHVAAPSAPRKAMTYAVRSAERACRATAYDEACRQYQHALAAAELDAGIDAREKLDVALLHGEAMRASGMDAEQVNRHFAALAVRAEALGDHRAFARAVLGYTGQGGDRFTPTQFDARVNEQEVALLERAMAALDADSDDLRVLLTCSLSFALLCSTDSARRERVAREAVTRARALAHPPMLARALLIYLRCAPECVRPEPKITACSELIDLTYAHGLAEQELEARSVRAIAHFALGDVHAARIDEQRMAILAEKIATPRARARARLPALMRAFWSGELVETETIAQQMLSACPLELAEQGLFTVRLAAVSAVRDGLNPGVISLHEQLHARYPEGVGFRCTLASIRATLGDEEAARTHFEWVAEGDFARIPMDMNWLSAMSLLADTAMHLGDARYAARVYDQLEPYGDMFDFCVAEGIPAGPVAHWLAELATTRGRYDEARGWIARARSLCERLGATLFHHVTMLAEARLWMCSEPEQRERARPLLEVVSSFAEARNAGWLRLRAENLIRQLSTAPSSPISVALTALIDAG